MRLLDVAVEVALDDLRRSDFCLLRVYELVLLDLREARRQLRRYVDRAAVTRRLDLFAEIRIRILVSSTAPAAARGQAGREQHKSQCHLPHVDTPSLRVWTPERYSGAPRNSYESSTQDRR